MTDVQREFLEFVWGDLEGYADIARMSDGDLKNHKWFEWPSQKDDLLAYVEKYSHEDIYYTPVLFRVPQRRRSAVKTAQVVYGDADLFKPEDLHARPSCIVHTSPEKTHVLWAVTDSNDVATLEGLAHSVSLEHPKATTGYDNGWSATKLLRVPGTKNLKYEGESFDVTVEYTGELYTVDSFSEHYALVPEMIFDPAPFPEEAMPSYTTALSSIPSSMVLEDLLKKKSHTSGSRYTALCLLYNEVFRLAASVGIDDATADQITYVIADKSPLHKWKIDKIHGASKMLWDDIQRARAKYGSAIDDDEPDFDGHDDDIVTVAPRAAPKGFDFLTQYEKENLPQTFIDQYMAWATGKTDAPRNYHVAGAFTILSTVFSDFGHAPMLWGPMPLNLWFMVLGSTTLSRKSTTKNLMLSMIEALENDAYKYELGSKFTAEGLDEALRQNANRSGLLHRDEIQAFMREADAKPYLQGIKGELTELYDGKVTGKLRASGEKNEQQRKGARVALVLFTMGIEEQLASYLTLEDFQSGFLTRFVFVTAPPPLRTKENDYIKQADPYQVKNGDPVFDAMKDRMLEAREHWEGWADPMEKTIPVMVTEEAWARFNKFVTDIKDAAEGTERAAVVDAAVARLTNSIVKAATLLAMWDMHDEVSMPHMLAAINYCGPWFEHMVSMSNKISASTWKRRQDELTDFIDEHGGEVNWKAAYRHFKNELRSREFFDLVQALEEAGMVTIRNEKSGSKFITSTGVK